MALKGDLMIYTQCLYNAIQYVLTASHTPIHPPKLRYSPSLNQMNHQFPIVHALFLSLENPSQVQKNYIFDNQKMNPYTCRYNG